MPVVYVPLGRKWRWRNWYAALVAGALIAGAFALMPHRRVRAMPPPPTVVEPPRAPAAAAPAPARPRLNHVLIISEDGLRADAVAKLHLHWHELLRQHGAWSLHAKTIRDASTLPAHASMLSGVDPKVHGLTWNTWRPSGLHQGADDLQRG